MSGHTDQLLVYQTILSEAQGNHRVAFEIACSRLALALHASSWAYMRRMAPATEGRIDDVPAPITDDWISTGREAAE